MRRKSYLVGDRFPRTTPQIQGSKEANATSSLPTRHLLSRIHMLDSQSIGDRLSLLQLQRNYGNRYVQRIVRLSRERQANISLTHDENQSHQIIVAPSNIVQCWKPKGHEQLTKTAVEKTLSNFEGFKFDEPALNKLISYSTDMDMKIIELIFNVGSKLVPLFSRQKQKKLKALQKYYAQHAERAQHHGEGGLYAMPPAQAAVENLKLQKRYEAQARMIFQQLSKTFHSTKECESTKSSVRESILSILGDALHIAQDRGAHGEGAAGHGHAREILEGINPDDKGKNADGYENAQRNTELLVLDASDMLYKLLNERYSRTCAFVQKNEVNT